MDGMALEAARRLPWMDDAKTCPGRGGLPAAPSWDRPGAGNARRVGWRGLISRGRLGGYGSTRRTERGKAALSRFPGCVATG